MSVDESDGPSSVSAEVRLILEKAKSFGASHVFFRLRPGRPNSPEALVFDDSELSGSRTDEEFAQLHRRLWSWGGVPLVYRRLRGRVDVFRCAHKPDFDTGREKPKYASHSSLDLLDTAVDITTSLEENPWWDMRRLANGTLWDDRSIAEQFLSDKSAHKTILNHVEVLERQLEQKSRLAANLRRRLLIISLLVAYLEDRDVFKLEAGFFAQFKPGAEKFHHVLADADALIELLKHLETERFNGNVFKLEEEEKEQLRKTPHLKTFAQLIEGSTESGGQRTLWRLYSFKDLPVELISHIYQLFVEDKSTCVYTPPFLARLMLEEALTLDRMDRLEERNEIVFDPSCGSGVFLVEAFKRLVLHWRKNNSWKEPSAAVLRKLMKRVRGTDIDGYAVELAAFSLCLAMCEELPSRAISKAKKLFPSLKGDTLYESCFFQQSREKKLPPRIGVIFGNPPFGSASQVGTTSQAYSEYLNEFGRQSLPDRQSAYLFLHHAMDSLVTDGLLCLIQKDNFLYNRRSAKFRQSIFERWDVRQILDFTPIRGLFRKDPKVVVVMAEARPPQPKRSILHAIFRRTAHTQAEVSFELDYYDMHWVSQSVAMSKDFVWRCNLFGGGRAMGLVERLKKLPTLKDYVEEQGWDYGEGFMVGTPENDEVIDYLYQKPVIPAKAIGADGEIDKRLISIQEKKSFQWPRSAARYAPPLILISEVDCLPVSYWPEKMGSLTYGHRIVGISGAEGNSQLHSELAERIRGQRSFFRSWMTLTSATAGIGQATTILKSDIDELPFPSNQKEIDLTKNELAVLSDAFDFYRDFQRLGDDSEIMGEVREIELNNFALMFSKQVNTIHKKLRALKPLSWAGVTCQPFVFGDAKPDWTDSSSLNERLATLLREQSSPSLTTIRIIRVFDGPFLFLIKPNRLRYWLRSIALRDADEALADLRNQGF